MNKKIIFDLDDCLASLKHSLCDALNLHCDRDIHWSEWNRFDSAIVSYDINPEQFFDVIIKNNLLENMIPYEETKFVLDELKKRKYDIIIETSRCYHPDALNLTKTWFTKYNLPYDEIIITGDHGMSKADYVKHYNDIQVSVDDNLENCKGFMDSGKIKNVILYDQPWNQDIGKNHVPSSLKRIFNLNEILQYAP